MISLKYQWNSVSNLGVASISCLRARSVGRSSEECNQMHYILEAQKQTLGASVDSAVQRLHR